MTAAEERRAHELVTEAAHGHVRVEVMDAAALSAIEAYVSLRSELARPHYVEGVRQHDHPADGCPEHRQCVWCGLAGASRAAPCPDCGELEPVELVTDHCPECGAQDIDLRAACPSCGGK